MEYVVTSARLPLTDTNAEGWRHFLAYNNSVHLNPNMYMTFHATLCCASRLCKFNNKPNERCSFNILIFVIYCISDILVYVVYRSKKWF